MTHSETTNKIAFADYEKADCTLFREKLIKTNKTKDYINKTLFDAWKNGGDVSSVVNSLLSDPKVIRDLEKQIAETIKFQKEYAQKNLQNYTQEQLFAYQQKFEDRKNQLEKEYQTRLKLYNEEKAKFLEGLQSGTSDLNAAQQEFGKLQEKIQNELSGLGGAKGLERIDALDSLIYDQESNKSSLSMPKFETVLYQEKPSFINRIEKFGRKVWDYVMFWK